MLFIKNGMHMVAIKEGSVINVKPNPKFVRENVPYGAIVLNGTPVGIYPLEDTSGYGTTVYSVFRDICKQINSGDKIITIPFSYHFKSVQDYNEFKNLLTDYSDEELMNIYYDGLSKISV